MSGDTVKGWDMAPFHVNLIVAAILDIIERLAQMIFRPNLTKVDFWFS